MSNGYFRFGKLVSADTFRAAGKRTLTGATEEHLWPGTALTRPTPTGERLRLVSTSADDDQVRQQKGTITIAGTMDAALADEYDVTVGGNADAGDVARIAIDTGTVRNYDYLVQVGDTTADIAQGLTDAVNSGSLEAWRVTPGGNIDAGDVARITIDGQNYDYTVQGGDTFALIAAGLVAAVNAGAGDPHYTAIAFGSTVGLVAKAAGGSPNPTSLYSTDPGADSTLVAAQLVDGTPASTVYTASRVGSVVTLVRNTAGVTTDTVTASYPTDPGVDSTCVAAHTVTGADADIVAVDDGATVFDHTVQAGQVVGDVATALAALINADAAYIASAVGAVITVEAAVPGAAFTFVDASTDNQTGDLAVTIDNDGLVQNGDGPGVRAVRIDYLDTTGVKRYEVVDLNGTTAVQTVATDIDEVLAVTATEVGSAGGAVGTVSVTNLAASAIFDVLPVGDVGSKPGAFAVRADQRGYIVGAQASATAATLVRVRSNVNPATGAVVDNATFPVAEFYVDTQVTSWAPEVPAGPFPVGARVWLSAQASAGKLVQGDVEGYLEPAV